MTLLADRPTRFSSPLTRRCGDELVDMIAVARFVKGDVVSLTALERRVAIHAARTAGQSVDSIAKRCRVHDRKITEELDRPVPTDALNRPLILTFHL